MIDKEQILDTIRTFPEITGSVTGGAVGGALTWFVNKLLKKRNRINLFHGIALGALTGRLGGEIYGRTLGHYAPEPRKSNVLDMVRKERENTKTAASKVSWNTDGTFILQPGGTVSGFVDAYNKSNPANAITVNGVLGLNPGVSADKFRAGTPYRYVSGRTTGTVSGTSVRAAPRLTEGTNRFGRAGATTSRSPKKGNPSSTEWGGYVPQWKLNGAAYTCPICGDKFPNAPDGATASEKRNHKNILSRFIQSHYDTRHPGKSWSFYK